MRLYYSSMSAFVTLTCTCLSVCRYIESEKCLCVSACVIMRVCVRISNVFYYLFQKATMKTTCACVFVVQLYTLMYVCATFYK